MTNTRIYIAARFGRRQEAERLANYLRFHGFTVVSRWHSEEAVRTWGTNDADPEISIRCLSDIRRCDAFVALSEAPDCAVAGAARGGRHCEFGIALALGKRLFVVGTAENAFHRHGLVTVVASEGELFRELKKLTA